MDSLRRCLRYLSVIPVVLQRVVIMLVFKTVFAVSPAAGQRLNEAFRRKKLGIEKGKSGGNPPPPGGGFMASTEFVRNGWKGALVDAGKTAFLYERAPDPMVLHLGSGKVRRLLEGMDGKGLR
jgi:hypothetical protein